MYLSRIEFDASFVGKARFQPYGIKVSKNHSFFVFDPFYSDVINNIKYILAKNN